MKGSLRDEHEETKDANLSFNCGCNPIVEPPRAFLGQTPRNGAVV